MGCNNSKTVDFNAIENNKMRVSNFPISEEQLRLVRESWKEMTKLEHQAGYGTLMMVK
jgi:hypothetical protein